MTGTVVHRKGQGALRQERPKTDASIRLISVPEFAAEVLNKTQLHDACHLARNESQLDGLIAIVNRILDQAPAY